MRVLAPLLRAPPQQIEHAHELILRHALLVQGAGQDRRRHRILFLLHERLPERLVRGHAVRRRAQRLLELGDRLVEQPHLLVRHAEVVMALVVLVVDVLGDALLELPEHVLEVRLLVARRLLLLDDHAGVLPRVVAAQPVAEVHEVVVADGGRRCGGGSGGARGARARSPLRRRGRRWRRGLRRGKGLQRRLDARVVRREVQHPLVDRA
jgi:hypothetical protein